MLIGVTAGLAAAVAYDVFRLPFVFARELGIAAVIPPLQLFKVFPGFGAMILGEPLDQQNYSVGTTVLGWAYHFSNGATFGVMYLALVGEATRRHWTWAIAMAVASRIGHAGKPLSQRVQHTSHAAVCGGNAGSPRDLRSLPWPVCKKRCEALEKQRCHVSKSETRNPKSERSPKSEIRIRRLSRLTTRSESEFKF